MPRNRNMAPTAPSGSTETPTSGFGTYEPPTQPLDLEMRRKIDFFDAHDARDTARTSETPTLGIESRSAQEASPEASVDIQVARVSLVETGQEFVADMQDRYGERAEEIKEAAKAKLRSLGKAASAFAAKAGFSTIGASVRGLEAGIAAGQSARQAMSDRKARRQAVIEKRIEQAQAEQLAAEQQAQMEQAQEDAFGTYEQNIDYAQAHEDALKDNEQFDNEKEAEAERQAKALRKADAAIRRKAMRRQRYETVKATGNEFVQVARGRTRGIGRTIAKFATRTKNAVTSGANAAKTSWQETAA